MAYRYMLLTLAIVAPFACGGGAGTTVVEKPDEEVPYNGEAPRHAPEQERPQGNGEQPDNAGEQPSSNPEGLDQRPDESPGTGGRPGTGGTNGTGAQPGAGGSNGTGAQPGTGGSNGTGTCPTDCSACEGVCLQCLCIAQGNTAACTSVCTPTTD